MAYNEGLADRIRQALARERGVDEIKMMGGLCFMIGGHMALGIVGEELMIRVGPDGYERALGRVHAREMVFTGRSMKGFVFVEPAGIRTKRSLASWVAPAAAKSLPPRPVKPSRHMPRFGAFDSTSRPHVTAAFTPMAAQTRREEAAHPSIPAVIRTRGP